MDPYIEITRPNVCALAGFAVITGAILSGITAFTPIATATAATILICAAGNTINDYFDRDIDKINQPKRPIPSGRITPRKAKSYAALLNISGLALAYTISAPFFSLALANAFISIIYASSLKKLPAIGNITDSYLASVTFLAGAFIEGSIETLSQTPAPILAIIAFLATMGREIIKDTEDIEGDKKEGAKTIPILIGAKKSMAIAKIFVISSIITAIIPYQNHTFTNPSYLIAISPSILTLIYSTTIKNPTKAQKTIKKGMFLGIAAFLLTVLAGW